MNKVLILSAVVLLSSISGISIAAEEKASAVVAEVVEVGNKICPVSSEKIGSMGEVSKIEFEGKSYNLCCSMCAKDFNKDPQKYSKIANDEVALEASTVKN